MPLIVNRHCEPLGRSNLLEVSFFLDCHAPTVLAMTMNFMALAMTRTR